MEPEHATRPLDYHKAPAERGANELRWFLVFAGINAVGVAMWLLTPPLPEVVAGLATPVLMVGTVGSLWWGSTLFDRMTARRK